jgi:hypothetical protein
MTDASATARLERGYRWLLVCYPARHRRAHGEEMIGVLLAAARDGQRRPGLGDSVNLLWGALLIWLRPRPAHDAAGGWRESLAAFSVAAPLAILALFFLGVMLRRGGATAGPVPLLAGAAFMGLGLAVPFMLLGLRRTAGVVCGLAALYLAGASFTVATDIAQATAGLTGFAFPVFAYATQSAAALGSPGRRRGWHVLDWRAWTLIGLAVAAADAFEWAIEKSRTYQVVYYRSGHSAVHESPVPHWLALAAAIAVLVLLVVGVAAARSPQGRRLAALFAIPAWPWLMGYLWPGPGDPLTALLLTYLPPLAIAALVVRAARRAGRAKGRGAAARA